MIHLMSHAQHSILGLVLAMFCFRSLLYTNFARFLFGTTCLQFGIPGDPFFFCFADFHSKMFFLQIFTLDPLFSLSNTFSASKRLVTINTIKQFLHLGNEGTVLQIVILDRFFGNFLFICGLFLFASYRF